MDSQLIEIIGRNRLINELLRGGLEVATPLRDRGIDLIAYVDIDKDLTSFIARPIQMKAASGESFSMDRKYEKVRGIILAYLWHLEDSVKAVTFALTYGEGLAVAEAMGWTKTLAWINGGKYANTKPGKELCRLLEPYRMTPLTWRDKVIRAAEEAAPGAALAARM